MTLETWQIAVVRAWRHGARRIIRVTLASSNHEPTTAFVASGREAAARLEEWLGSGSAVAAEDEGETRTGRTSDGESSTLAAGGDQS